MNQSVLNHEEIATEITSSKVSNDTVRAGNYLLITGNLLAMAASIGVTLIMYLTTIATLYVVLGRTKWWKLLRLRMGKTIHWARSSSSVQSSMIQSFKVTAKE